MSCVTWSDYARNRYFCGILIRTLLEYFCDTFWFSFDLLLDPEYACHCTLQLCPVLLGVIMQATFNRYYFFLICGILTRTLLEYFCDTFWNTFWVTFELLLDSEYILDAWQTHARSYSRTILGSCCNLWHVRSAAFGRPTNSAQVKSCNLIRDIFSGFF